MTLAVLVAGVLFLAPSYSQAQSINVLRIDAQNYPHVRALIEMRDRSYMRLEDADARFYEVREDGVLISKIQLQCLDTNAEQEGDVVFVVDKSSSMSMYMDAGLTISRIDATKRAIQAYVRKFSVNPNIRFGCVTFSSDANLIAPLSHDTTTLMKSIAALTTTGGTNYTAAFLDTANGAIAALSKSSALRKQIVFITDGVPEPPFFKDSVIQLCLKNNIHIDAFVIVEGKTQDLSGLCDATNGELKSFTDAYELIDSLSNYQGLAKTLRQCWFTWDIKPTCSSAQKERQVEVRYIGFASPLSSSISYMPPPQAQAWLDVRGKARCFYNTQANSEEVREIVISAMNAPFKLSALQIEPPGLFEVVPSSDFAPGTVVGAGNAARIRVRHRQGESPGFHSAALHIIGSPCDLYVPLLGGAPNLEVIDPSAETTYTDCDGVPIRWRGVADTAAVDLWVSTDGDSLQEWRSIESGVRGGSYRWIKGRSGIGQRVHATQSIAPGYLWTRRFGAAGADSCASICVDNTKSLIAIAGSFSQSIGSGTQQATSQGANDMFVMQLDNDGNIKWLRAFGSAGDETATAITNGPSGSYFVGGAISKNAVALQGTTLSPNPSDVQCPFLMQLDKNGNVQWAVLGKATIGASCTARVDSIAVEGDSVFISGRYLNSIRFDGASNSTGYIELRHSGPVSTVYWFTASFGKNGKLGSLIDAKMPHNYQKGTISDGTGYKYDVSTFSGRQDNAVDSLSFNSSGSSDVSVRKWHPALTVHDDAPAAINILESRPRLERALIDAGSANVGDSIAKEYLSFIYNDGERALQVKGLKLTGPDVASFSIRYPTLGESIVAHGAVGFTLVLRPQRVGVLHAYAQLVLDCDTLRLEFSGVGSQLSTVEETNVDGLKLWPVPTSDKINIAMEDPTETILSIDVINTAGELVYRSSKEESSSNSTFRVDLQGHGSEMLYCRIHTSRRTLSRVLPLIQH